MEGGFDLPPVAACCTVQKRSKAERQCLHSLFSTSNSALRVFLNVIIQSLAETQSSPGAIRLDSALWISFGNELFASGVDE